MCTHVPPHLQDTVAISRRELSKPYGDDICQNLPRLSMSKPSCGTAGYSFASIADGTVGIGEGGVHGWQRPTKTMVEVMTPYLLGKNPHHIEHHYQFLYRSSHFMGAVVQG